MHPLVRQVRMYAVEVGKKHPQHGRAIDDVLRIMDEEIARPCWGCFLPTSTAYIRTCLTSGCIVTPL